MSATPQVQLRCAQTCNGYYWAMCYPNLRDVSLKIGCSITRPASSWFAPAFRKPGSSATKQDDAETERQTTLPLFVHPIVRQSLLLFTRSVRRCQRMIAPRLLRKQLALSWNFCPVEPNDLACSRI